MPVAGLVGVPSPSRARKVVRIMLAIAGGTLAIAVAGVVFLALWSRGEPAPVVDGWGRPVAGSLSEKVFVEIDGVRQGMFIVSRDVGNPVLLFLHGGPGMPEFFLAERHPTGLDAQGRPVIEEAADLSVFPEVPLNEGPQSRATASGEAIQHARPGRRRNGVAARGCR